MGIDDGRVDDERMRELEHIQIGDEGVTNQNRARRENRQEFPLHVGQTGRDRF